MEVFILWETDSGDEGRVGRWVVQATVSVKVACEGLSGVSEKVGVEFSASAISTLLFPSPQNQQTAGMW